MKKSFLSLMLLFSVGSAVCAEDSMVEAPVTKEEAPAAKEASRFSKGVVWLKESAESTGSTVWEFGKNNTQILSVVGATVTISGITYAVVEYYNKGKSKKKQLNAKVLVPVAALASALATVAGHQVYNKYWNVEAPVATETTPASEETPVKEETPEAPANVEEVVEDYIIDFDGLV